MVTRLVKDFPALSMNNKRVKELESQLEESRTGKNRQLEGDEETEEPQAKVFKTTAPTSHTPKAVQKWVESLKLNKDQKKKFETDCEKLPRSQSKICSPSCWAWVFQ